jgi:excisionase family DNA binding protein
MNNTTSPMTTGDVAQIFGVTINAVKQWAVDGRIPYFRTPGGHYRFHKSDVERLREKAAATQSGEPR